MLLKAEKAQAEAKAKAKAKEEEQKIQATSTAQASNSSPTEKTVSSNSNTGIQSSGQQQTGFAGIVANSKTAKLSDQIVTVVASGTSAAVTLWEKANNVWSQILTTQQTDMWVHKVLDKPLRALNGHQRERIR